MPLELITTKENSPTLEVHIEVPVVDASNAAEMKAQLKQLDTKGYETVLVDVSKMEFVDSSGIGALLSFYKQVGEGFALKNPTATVLSVLELLRLHRVFKIEHDS